LPETGTVAVRAAREAIGRRRLHQDQNSRTELYLLGALASMRARRVGALCEAFPVPKAVIFDLDGVLLDSEQLWNRAKEQLTRCSGGGWHEDAPTVMLGMSSPEWARYLPDELAVPLDPQDINRQVVRRMQELYREQLPLLPGALDVVRALRQRWPLGLAFFSNREIIELFLKLGELAGTFAATVSSEEVARGKPAPDVYLAAAEKMGVDPTKSAAEEDSSNGLRAATAAGMTVIAVPNPHYPPTDDALKLAAATVDAIADLTPKVVERVAG
jgi:HAD superfamily hydrolase (TIGR01509 family)